MASERFAVALSFLLFARAALGQDAIPPKPTSAPAIPYPEGARGEAEVTLELEIDARGEVTGVKTLSGGEPFLSRAVEGARAFRYEPARKNGAPVRARVRLVVAFRPPKPSAPSVAVVDPEVTDVRVRGLRADPLKTSLPVAEIRQIPGTFGDPFRALEALPGVTPIVSGIPFFFVRGAPPGNTGYFLDGVRVPLLFHLALGPGVIHPALVDKVDFYPGGYPARFGRFSGGVVAGETRAPQPKPHGEANLRLFDAGALVETPIGDRVTALVAGRYSYAAALVQVFAPDTRVAYWDYQGRLHARLGKHDTVSLFAFGSFDEILGRDRIGTVVGSGEPIKSDFYPVFSTEFHRLDMRWDHAFDRGRVRTAVTRGIDRSGTSTNAELGTFVGTTLTAVRSELELREGPSARLRAGADAMLQDFTLSPRGSAVGSTSLYPPRQEVVIGGFAELALRIDPRLEVTAGLRFDLYDAFARPQTTRTRLGTLVGGASSFALEPRVQSRLEVSRGLAYLASFGIAHQPPSFFVPVPGLSIGRLNRGLQAATQLGQGIELALPLDLTLSATGFLHAYTGLTDATTTCLDFNGTSSVTRDCLDDRVRGRAFGLELLLRRPLTKRLTGWLSYTLSRSTRDTSGLRVAGRSPIGEGDILSDFDRTHVVALVGAYDLGAGWRAGVRLQYYTGRPYSKRLGGDFGSVTLPPYNAARLPDFARLDLRVEKAWSVLGGRLSVVLEWLNATLSPEAIGVDACTFPGAPPSGIPLQIPTGDVTCTFRSIGPISIPSVGLEGQL